VTVLVGDAFGDPDVEAAGAFVLFRTSAGSLPFSSVVDRRFAIEVSLYKTVDKACSSIAVGRISQTPYLVSDENQHGITSHYLAE
jgi:hypothetical protein